MGIELLRNASVWVSELEGFDTVAQAIEYVNMERSSHEQLSSVYFEEICRCDLALLELGCKLESLESKAINKLFTLYKKEGVSADSINNAISIDKITQSELVEHDNMLQLINLEPEFIADFFELDDKDQDIVLTWLDYHDYKNFGNDPSDILEMYQGIYSAIEYVNKYMDDHGIELPEVISINYDETFEDLTGDCTTIKIGSRYMIFND